MALTASYTAACIMAKLRVGWMVAGCAPGVRTMTRSVLFHCTTWLTGVVACAIAGAKCPADSAATIVPASNRVFISALHDSERFEPVDPAGTIRQPKRDHRSMSAGSDAASTLAKTVTASSLFSNFSDPEFDIGECPVQGHREPR